MTYDVELAVVEGYSSNGKLLVSAYENVCSGLKALRLLVTIAFWPFCVSFSLPRVRLSDL